MGATTKLLLDEMKKMSDHIDSCFNAIKGRLEGLERRDNAADDRIKPLEEKVEEIAVWQQGVDSSVANLASKMDFMVLTPKFGKETDLWAQIGEESV
jgi:archaellum component FlaC